LAANDDAACGEEVVALGVDFLAPSLDIEDGGARAGFLFPEVGEGFTLDGKLRQLFVGVRVEIVGQGLSLDRGHVVDFIGEGMIVVLLADALHCCDQAVLRELEFTIGDDFGAVEIAVLEAHEMLAFHDPRLELVVVVAKDLATFDGEEFWVECSFVQDQPVRLETHCFQWCCHCLFLSLFYVARVVQCGADCSAQMPQGKRILHDYIWNARKKFQKDVVVFAPFEPMIHKW